MLDSLNQGKLKETGTGISIFAVYKNYLYCTGYESIQDSLIASIATSCYLCPEADSYFI